jgi:hypothetical protein
MSFLQPMLLAALPLVGLPIIIHLINQRRYQTIRWAAMMFLLAANRMSRGYARLRQWLILLFRMVAIAGLILAVSRPLTGGWLGLAAGGRADTTILLLDRSPSMEQGGATAGGGGSKRESGLRQLVQALRTLGSDRWVLIESGSNRPREIESIESLLTSTSTEPTSASADLPAMLQVAREYIRANKLGRTEVWICSDLRTNDWNPDGGRWPALRDAFLESTQGVRFHLLAYPQTAPTNLAVRVAEVRRQKTADGADLFVTVQLARDETAQPSGGSALSSNPRPGALGSEDGAPPSSTRQRTVVHDVNLPKLSIPVQFEIGGARSEVTVEMAGTRYELKDHRIPLGHGQERGWGRVSIPADVNPADNDYWFVFADPAPRRAVIVAGEGQDARPLQLAASIAPDPAVQCSAEVVEPDHLAEVDWGSVALLLWQAPLPQDDAAAQVRKFIDRGGEAIFFPPPGPDGAEFLGVRWTSWSGGSQEFAVENWRGDEDLLAHTQSGTPLPVGQIVIKRYCGLKGEFTPLATLKGGTPLLARVTTNHGGASFCATTPAVGDSSLATNGVVLYVLVQRAEASGVEALATTRQLVAGDPAREDPTTWKRLDGVDSTADSLHGGVYSSGDRLLAVNRSGAEDSATVLADRRVDGLFRGLEFARVDDRAGGMDALIQEVWRLFLAAMMVALVVEAGLCLPKYARAGGGRP